MNTECIDVYGNERKDGHIHVAGHDGCARCGAQTGTGTGRTTG